MDEGVRYGFSISIVILGAVGTIGAILQYFRTRQSMSLYSFICLAATFSFIRRTTYIAAINNDTLDPVSSRHMVEGNMARLFLFKMFIPLLYCVFFETCHNLVSMTLTTTAITTGAVQAKYAITVTIGTTIKSKIYYYVTKLSGMTLAYVWTTVLIAVNIAYCSVFANSFPIFTEERISNLQNMSRFTSYGVWVYFILALLQLVLGWNEVRPYMLSLLAYLLFVCIGTMGMTTIATLPNVTPNDELVNQIVSFVLVELVGLFGLFFALFASTQYWTIIKQPSTPTPEAPNNLYDSSVPIDSKFGNVTQPNSLEDTSQNSITSTVGSSSTKQLDQRSNHSKYIV
ncbi:hypothetical protein BDA99DRAFT_510393 [Phascolomyces articulosus]|uniref:Uncharacterized protein n=1 Tax=Phascolomyces articulosus TaxID=60185 RepID=A0AAD5PFA3_9FUNG|nr:hypothetical protein BDA99DRAFT_510393 [Phascolomyces articulosus]